MSWTDEELVAAAKLLAGGGAASNGDAYPTREQAKAAGDSLRDELRTMGIERLRVDTKIKLGETRHDEDTYYFVLRKGV